MTSAGYLRYPHLHGDLLTFVAERDVWLAPRGGGRAWRVSADQADAGNPRFSPDGTMIAWRGRPDGGPEIYLAGLDGGGRRLTYWGDQSTQMCGWTPAGEVLAITAAGQPFGFATWAYAVPAGTADSPADGSPRRLPFGPVTGLAASADAVALLNGTFGADPAQWKRYRGGTAGRLWVREAGLSADEAGQAGPVAGQRPAARFRRLLAGLGSQFYSPMLAGGRFAFLSDHEGTGNLYSCALDGSDLRRHTDHDGFYARGASSDGTSVVYHCAGEIWLLADLGAGTEASRVPITIGSPAAARAPRLLTAEDHLGSLSCDTAGQASAIEVRGTVHWLTHRDGPATALSVRPGSRARLPRVLGSAGQVVWVTDAGGADALEIGSAGSAAPGSGDAGQPRRLAEGAIGRVSGLAAAPDGSTIAVAAHDGRLLLVDAGSGQVTELAPAGNGDIDGLAWSPDSAWLAWSQPADLPGDEPLRRLRLARVADAAIADITDGRFADTEPVFSKDGKYLAFLSRRGFDPVYDAQVFDLSFPYGYRPFLVPLAAATPSPFGPLPGGRPVGEGGQDGKKDDGQPEQAEAAAARSRNGEPGAEPAAGAKPGAGQGGGDRDEQAEPVVVDLDGLAGRVIQVPVPESRYSSLRAVKGGLAWLRRPLAGNLGQGGANAGDPAPRPCLERFDLTSRKCTELAEELDWFEASGDGKHLLVSDHGKLTVVPADRKANPDNAQDQVQVDLSRARYLADPAALWRAAYAEAGRVIAHDFWVSDLADVDWDAAQDDYRPLLDRITDQSDFADLLWELLGELGSSHAYVAPAEPKESGKDGAVGLLGADLDRGGDGSWLVRRIVPGETSDPRAKSPLAAPGAGLRAGDAILAVDGRPVDGAHGPAPLLVGAAGKPVELTVATAGGQPRRAVVTPLRNERRLRYLDWVAGRRELVRELGQGRLGYLHVPDMVSQGWADFHRDLRSEMTRDGLIFDVRGNSGGHTSELVVEKIARRVIGWDVPRGKLAGTYPQDAPRGPIVALADECAGSDGDIVTAAVRSLGLGPVVGTRTWGGVIGFDDLHELADGTRITVPRYSFWFSRYGWGVENYGVDPDVEVVITPDDWGAGRDPQLETAVRLALEALTATPAISPPATAERPSRRRPPLPPRPPG